MYPNQQVTENLTEDLTENLTENRLTLIMNEMKLNPKISYNQLSKILDVARMTVFRDIEKLKEAGQNQTHWPRQRRTLGNNQTVKRSR